MQMNEIITGDCREILPTIPSKSFTLAFADPPYWVGFDYGDKTDEEMDYIEPEWLVSELLRIADVVMITPGQKSKYLYPVPKWEAIWHKPGAMNVNGFGGVSNFEPILCYGKGILRNDYFKAPIVPARDKDAAFHRCPKPYALLEQVVHWTTNPGDSVIDPVCGSATTCKAAFQLGRNYLGIELDEKIAQQARKRLSSSQPPLLSNAVDLASQVGKQGELQLFNSVGDGSK